MAERVILHVGPNKTGTTALQEAFQANAGVLARHQIAYPMTGRDRHAHHGIATACMTGDEKMLRDLADEVRWEKSVLLSSELFAGLGPLALGRISRTFGGARFEVIYTLRRLADLWPSHWKEMVKHGQHLSFSEFTTQAPDTDRSAFRALPMPTRQLHDLAQVFGRESLRLISYETRSSSNGAFGTGFASDVLRLDDHSTSFGTARRNQTPPAWKIEVLRLVNLRAMDQLNAAETRELAGAALNRLDVDPPAWTGAFRTLFGGSDALTISSQTPALLAEQNAVLRDFGDRLIDPPDAYMGPAEMLVRTFDANQLGHDLSADIDEFYVCLLTRGKNLHDRQKT